MRAIAGSWRFRVLLLLTWTIAVQTFLWGKLFFTGDEPHYLMSVISFVRDGDFNLYNNYQQGDQKSVGHPNLEPQQWLPPHLRTPGLIPAEHGTVFPIIVALPYKLGGITGIRMVLAFSGMLTCLVLAAAVDLITGNKLTGSLSMALLAFAPTWQMQASRIYPETFAGFLSAIVLAILAWEAAPVWAIFIAGFLIAFLHVIYVKYIAISAALFLAVLLLPDIRRRPAFWAGVAAAVALSAVNKWLWADQGASGGDFQTTLPYLFSLTGVLERFWKPFLDRHHGVEPYQPYIILVLWAMISFLKPVENRRQTVIAGLGLIIAFYTLMHGIWTSGPGFSMPGRYFVAAMPAFCAALAIWSAQDDDLRWMRWGFLGAGIVMTAVIYAGSVWQNLPPYFALQPWRALWPRYWDSWELNSALEVVPVGLTAYYMAFLVLLTKIAGHLWLQRRKMATDKRR